MVEDNKALVVRSRVQELGFFNEAEKTFRGISNKCFCEHEHKGVRCREFVAYRGAVIEDETWCVTHAPKAAEEDAAHILEELERLQEGVRKLTRRGIEVHSLASFLASLDLTPWQEEEFPSDPPSTPSTLVTFL